MYISSIIIKNFKAIKYLELENLSDMVVIAGPNGCGKSCIFDAIRLIKSTYGGYQPNEYQQWFGEFQINLNQRLAEVSNLFREKDKEIKISIVIKLVDEEKTFILEHASNILKSMIGDQISAETINNQFGLQIPISSQIEIYNQVVINREDEIQKIIKLSIDQNEFLGEITIGTNMQMSAMRSPILATVFSIFSPQNIGIIDYHGATRNYSREQIGGVNLNIETSENQMKSNALYNYANKYTNIKSEMASALVRELLAEKSGTTINETESLSKTLSELFNNFIPTKKFLGPQPTPDGKILFTVVTSDGSKHDINELSSGEKEILYGYLRIHNLSPKNSILLLDEPELHLNPRLVIGLPQFYYHHLGKGLNNQIWLLTHSDTLLRESLKDNDFNVYHMRLPDEVVNSNNQIEKINIEEEIQSTVFDLIGDLATYKPGEKVVIFEGGGDTDFDITFVNALFPTFQNKVNMISGENKTRVESLHLLLEKARKNNVLTQKFFSVVDKDFTDEKISQNKYVMVWNVYHIENYLLSAKHILSSIQELQGNQCKFIKEEEIESALMEVAKEILPNLVREKMENITNNKILKCISTKIRRGEKNQTPLLRSAIISSLKKIEELAESGLSETELVKIENEINNELQNDIAKGDWINKFPGRDILKCFIGKYANGLPYIFFRNSIIGKMKIDSYQPKGMKAILDKIIED